jgi:hypothetical protein
LTAQQIAKLYTAEVLKRERGRGMICKQGHEQIEFWGGECPICAAWTECKRLTALNNKLKDEIWYLRKLAFEYRAPEIKRNIRAEIDKQGTEAGP